MTLISRRTTLLPLEGKNRSNEDQLSYHTEKNAAKSVHHMPQMLIERTLTRQTKVFTFSKILSEQLLRIISFNMLYTVVSNIKRIIRRYY